MAAGEAVCCVSSLAAFQGRSSVPASAGEGRPARDRGAPPLRPGPSFENTLVENVAIGSAVVLTRPPMDLLASAPQSGSSCATPRATWLSPGAVTLSTSPSPGCCSGCTNVRCYRHRPNTVGRVVSACPKSYD